MGNLNRRRAIGAARAAVRDDGGCLARAARKRFTADGLLAGTNERPLCFQCALARIRAFASMSPIGTKRTSRDCLLLVRFRGKADIHRAALTETGFMSTRPNQISHLS